MLGPDTVCHIPAGLKYGQETLPNNPLLAYAIHYRPELLAPKLPKFAAPLRPPPPPEPPPEMLVLSNPTRKTESKFLSTVPTSTIWDSVAGRAFGLPATSW